MVFNLVAELRGCLSLEYSIWMIYPSLGGYEARGERQIDLRLLDIDSIHVVVQL